MRLIERTTRFALWARALAFIAALTSIIAIILRHAINLDVETMIYGLAASNIVAFIAIFLAVLAYIRIWSTGDLGWRRATHAIAISLVVAAPGFVALAKSTALPQVFEVSSNPKDKVFRLRPAGFVEPVRTQIELTEFELAKFFPKIQTQESLLEVPDAFEIALSMVSNRNWVILNSRLIDPAEGDSFIHAEARSIIFKFETDIHIRIRPTFDGSMLDMMSSSRYGIHDLGTNGQLIESFFDEFNKRSVAGLPETVQEEVAEETVE